MPDARRIVGGMCRNIHTLHNFEPAASSDRGARRRTPVRAQDRGHDEAVEGEPGGVRPRRARDRPHHRHLLDDLVAVAPPKNREEEAEKARARAIKSGRYAAA